MRLVRIRLVGVLVAAIVAATVVPVSAGSWRTFHGGPRRTGEAVGRTAIEPSVAARFRVEWSGRVGDMRFSPSAVASGGLAYVASLHRLRAFDLVSGRREWQAERIAAGIESTAGIGRGIVVVGTMDGLRAFRARDGRPLWTSGARIGAVQSSPVVVGDVVIVGVRAAAHRPSTWALDVRTGRTIWKSAAPMRGNQVTSSPAVTRRAIFVTTWDDSTLWSLDAASGEIRWQVNLPSGFGGEITSTPAFAGGRVFVGWGECCWSGGLRVFDADTGVQVWDSNTLLGPVQASPAVAERRVVVGDLDGTLAAFRVGSGRLLWSVEMPRRSLYSSPALAGGVVFVGIGGKLVAFDLRDGARLWSSRPDGTDYDGWSSPAVVDDRVLLVGAERLWAFEARDTGA